MKVALEKGRCDHCRGVDVERDAGEGGATVPYRGEKK